MYIVGGGIIFHKRRINIIQQETITVHITTFSATFKIFPYTTLLSPFKILCNKVFGNLPPKLRQ